MVTIDEQRRLLLTPEEVAEQLQISPWLLRRMRSEGRGPEPVRLGHRTVRYTRSAIEAWLRSQEVQR